MTRALHCKLGLLPQPGLLLLEGTTERSLQVRQLLHRFGELDQARLVLLVAPGLSPRQLHQLWPGQSPLRAILLLRPRPVALPSSKNASSM